MGLFVGRRPTSAAAWTAFVCNRGFPRGEELWHHPQGVVKQSCLLVRHVLDHEFKVAPQHVLWKNIVLSSDGYQTVRNDVYEITFRHLYSGRPLSRKISKYSIVHRLSYAPPRFWSGNYFRTLWNGSIFFLFFKFHVLTHAFKIWSQIVGGNRNREEVLIAWTCAEYVVGCWKW